MPNPLTLNSAERYPQAVHQGGGTMEKRSTTRFYDPGSVVCSQFNAADHHDAQMVNFSSSGMCFRTDRFFKPGTTVLIRLTHCPKGAAGRQEEGGLRTTTLAKVLWCRDDEDLSGPRFVNGVHYF
jgi:hypothetical protein